MTIHHEAHRICVIARTYPRSVLWAWLAATTASGLAGNIYLLMIFLTLLFVTMLHLFNRMWSPPVYVSRNTGDVFKREGQHVKRES